ncbi:MAG: sulfite exporter TauE/SafE family protein [Clostridia bacterium]|nr:sulfite exporter TauE/SafE family protein [Clostridia bacterium]MDY5263860.1 sulfite exporter TauE/SafE family protein [Eubacteriales bacterium]
MSKNNDKKSWKERFSLILDVIVGGVSGLVGGLFGAGGGMLVVPTLTTINDFDARRAHATAILAVLPLTIASSIVYSSNGYFDLNVFTYVVIGSVIGGLIGQKLLRNLSCDVLSLTFNGLMIFAGVQMIL